MAQVEVERQLSVAADLKFMATAIIHRTTRMRPASLILPSLKPTPN